MAQLGTIRSKQNQIPMQKTQNPASPCQVSRTHCEIRHSFTSHICSTLTFPSRLRLTLLFIYRPPWRKLYGPGISKILESPLPFRLFFLSVARGVSGIVKQCLSLYFPHDHISLTSFMTIKPAPPGRCCQLPSAVIFWPTCNKTMSGSMC